MTELTPYPPPPPPPFPPPPKEPRSLWKPIGITLATTAFLSFSTCAGAISMGVRSKGLSGWLLYAGVVFLGLFVLTLNVAMVYFLIWIILKMVKR
jgi:F0F1-type ATP synthase membrane subunit a